MRILVEKTTKAASCPLGIKSKEYQAGETYDMFEELAEVFLKQKWGVLADNKVAKEAPKKEATVEKKVLKKAPKNKALKKAPKNKKL